MNYPNALLPHLIVKDASKALDFYKAALGATEVTRMPGPNNKLMHASMTIEGCMFFLCDDFPEFHAGKSRLLPDGMISPITLHLCVPDADHAIDRAVKVGATVAMPAMDAFWGDRYGKILDPFGVEWSFSHPLPPDRKAAAEKEWAEMQGKHG